MQDQAPAYVDVLTIILVSFAVLGMASLAHAVSLRAKHLIEKYKRDNVRPEIGGEYSE